MHFQCTERAMVKAMCGVELMDRRVMDLMKMLGMNEVMYQYVNSSKMC